MEIREALPPDGAAIASIFRDGSAYYVDLAPGLFQIPEEDGLLEFVTPRPEENPATILYLVADVDNAVVGHLYAELLTPADADRFQGNADLSKVRLFIHGSRCGAITGVRGSRQHSSKPPKRGAGNEARCSRSATRGSTARCRSRSGSGG